MLLNCRRIRLFAKCSYRNYDARCVALGFRREKQQLSKSNSEILNTVKYVLLPLKEETAEYSCDTVLWLQSLTADKAVEQCLDVLPSPSTCTSDRGLVLTPVVHWHSVLYTLSWCCQWRSRETASHVEDRAEIPAVSDCTWPVCSHSDFAAVSVPGQCNSCRHIQTSQTSTVRLYS